MSNKVKCSLSQGLITLAAFSGLMATSYVNIPSASAAAISSFQSSCRNISISGDTLSASCRRVNGTFNKTSILIRGIKNNNGNLVSIGLNDASSFQSSCRSISITGDTLSASCRRVNGTFNKTSTLIRGIKNNNGNLTY